MERYIDIQIHLYELLEIERFLMTMEEKRERRDFYRNKWINELSSEEKAKYGEEVVVSTTGTNELVDQPAKKSAFHFYKTQVFEDFKDQLSNGLMTADEVYRYAVCSFKDMSVEEQLKFF
jgi:hypothetical protein